MWRRVQVYYASLFRMTPAIECTAFSLLLFSYDGMEKQGFPYCDMRSVNRVYLHSLSPFQSTGTTRSYPGFNVAIYTEAVQHIEYYSVIEALDQCDSKLFVVDSFSLTIKSKSISYCSAVSNIVHRITVVDILKVREC